MKCVCFNTTEQHIQEDLDYLQRRGYQRHHEHTGNLDLLLPHDKHTPEQMATATAATSNASTASTASNASNASPSSSKRKRLDTDTIVTSEVSAMATAAALSPCCVVQPCEGTACSVTGATGASMLSEYEDRVFNQIRPALEKPKPGACTCCKSTRTPLWREGKNGTCRVRLCVWILRWRQ